MSYNKSSKCLIKKCDEENNQEKNSQEKHTKYIDFYTEKMGESRYEEFWALGIENESYLTTEKMEIVNTAFLMNNTKRERYSVDYFLNYNMENYKQTISSIKKATIPHYINSYMFQKVDIYGEHRTLYTKGIQYNKKFCGMTIHDYMMYTSKTYVKLFNKSVVFDGDTFEFITMNFYKTNVDELMNELKGTKHIFLRELNKYLANKFIFSGDTMFKYPSYNHGFVKFTTNKNNIAVCNSGTYNINITLPTTLSLKEMTIKNPAEFKETHKNAVRFIQWIEPLIVALYGTPDILSCISKDYCRGSLRIMMSRYIGLGTYDTDTMENGKKLNDFDYKKDPLHYYNELHNANANKTIYYPQDMIGYDINYNKFKNHGIELRFFDYFPEEYLTDVINFIILVCQHSIYRKNVLKPQDNKLWNELVVSCIQQGSDAMITNEMYMYLREIFGMEYECCCFSLFSSKKDRKVIKVITKISDFLYEKYKEDDMIKKMSPMMKKNVWVDYNSMIREKYKNSLEFQ